MDSLINRKQNIENIIEDIENMIANHVDGDMLRFVHEDELRRLFDELQWINNEIDNGD